MAELGHRIDARSSVAELPCGLPRWIDVAFSASGLVISLPVLAIAAIAVKTSPGPVLFRQERVGLGGSTFVLIKLRTMSVGALGGPLFTANDDVRTTRAGRLLRKFKIDELPELWNVIRGDMALVGPRPEVPAHYDWQDPRSYEILRVRPGLTDPVTLRLRNEEDLLATVAGDRDAFYRTRLRPFKLDGYVTYMNNRSWLTDLLTLVKSACVVVAPHLAPPPSFEEIDAPSHRVHRR